jgi:hypothetical protein
MIVSDVPAIRLALARRLASAKRIAGLPATRLVTLRPEW